MIVASSGARSWTRMEGAVGSRAPRTSFRPTTKTSSTPSSANRLRSASAARCRSRRSTWSSRERIGDATSTDRVCRVVTGYRGARDHLDDIVRLARLVFARATSGAPEALAAADLELVELGEI